MHFRLDLGSILRSSVGAGALGVWLAAPLGALVYVQSTDEGLVANAELIVSGEVVGVLDAPAERMLTVRVDRRLKGLSLETIVVPQVGGTEWFAVGAPQLVLGDRALFFLRRVEDRWQADPAQGFLREEAGAFVTPLTGERRDDERFIAWVLAGGRARGDYWLSDVAVAEYSLWEFCEGPGGPPEGAVPFRWRDFPVHFYATDMELSGANGSTDWSDLTTSTARWEAAGAGIAIDLTLTAERSEDFATAPHPFYITEAGGLTFDSDRGTVGVTYARCGIPFESPIGPVNEPRQIYLTLADNFLDWFSVSDWRQVMVHEVGHLLGLDHSLETGAVMRARMDRDRGDHLGEDDVAAVVYLYGASSPPPPPTPPPSPGPVEEPDRYDEGYDAGYEDGHADGYGAGRAAGYEDGHADGYEEGFDAPRRVCSVDGRTLDLHEGAVGVRVAREGEDGEWSDAHVVPENCSADSGLFSFFTPDNWEVLVKVLNGCAVNGHWWVIAAPATDLGWSLEVDASQATGRPGDVWSRTAGQDETLVIDASAFECQ